MRRLTALLLIGLLLLGSAACSKTPDYNMSTGCDDGVYHKYGKAFAETIEAEAGLKIKVLSTNGAKANMIIIDEDPKQIGITQADLLNHSWNETNIFEKEGKIDSLRAIGNIFSEQLMLVTTDPAIQSIEDLKGKVVSLGSVYSGTYINAMDLLYAIGLKDEDLPALNKNKMIKNFNLTAGLEALEEGEIDAAFITTALPCPALTEFMEEQPLYIVPLEQQALDQMKEENSDYSASEIPAQFFTDQTQAIPTLTVKTTLFCGADCDEEDIYTIAKLALENVEIQFAHSGLDLPFHKGAAKYFKEKGIQVQSK